LLRGTFLPDRGKPFKISVSVPGLVFSFESAFLSMPANLTQQYLKAEQAWRRATTPQEELECLQIMLKELPKHKGTDKLQADLKQKISRVKKEAAQPQKSAGKRGFRLPRQGAGRAVIIGGPNTGKSRLLAALTNAKPEIAEYPFSTLEPQPGMMPWEDATVQLVDTPPITADVLDPVTLSLIRGADLVLLMLNLGDDDGGQQLHDVWQQINQTKSRLGAESCVDEDDMGITYTRTFLVVNKIDLPEAADRLAFFAEYIDFELPTFRISALQQSGLEPLREAIYRSMDVVRVYTKLPHKKEADMDAPFLLPRGQTVLDLAGMIHKDVARNFKSARVWGSEVHDGTSVKGDYVLHDKDIVELSS
jgi:ribosome-interacting GTPase 1